MSARIEFHAVKGAFSECGPLAYGLGEIEMKKSAVHIMIRELGTVPIVILKCYFFEELAH